MKLNILLNGISDSGVTSRAEWDLKSCLKINANGWKSPLQSMSCHKHIASPVKGIHLKSPTPKSTAIFFPTCNSVQAQKAKFSPVPSCLLLHLGSLSSRVDEDTSFPPKKKRDMSIITGLTWCMSAQAKMITESQSVLGFTARASSI